MVSSTAYRGLVGHDRQRSDKPIGQILAQMGVLRRHDLDRALARQETTGGRLGEVLLADGAVREIHVSSALARQWGLPEVNLEQTPPDRLLLRAANLDTYLHAHILPWQQIGDEVIYAVADPAGSVAALERLGADPRAPIVVAPRHQIEDACTRALAPEMAVRAATRTPEELSVRGLQRLRQGFAAVILGIVAALTFGGPWVMAAGLLLLFAINACTTTLRLTALLCSSPMRKPLPSPDTISFAKRRNPARISLMIPLYREADMVPGLLGALEKIEYPRELMEVLLLLERSDYPTRAMVEATQLPGWVRPVVVPDGAPRTKPRALNHALSLARGEIIGILDAEDHPAP
ncbi:MAG: glycosyltransferase, partial [Pseudomonadota bacterium]